MAEKTPITQEDIDAARESFEGCRSNLIARNAVSSMDVLPAACNPEAAARATTTFDVQLQDGEICNQNSSGRCWMFAALNTMRYRVMKNLDIKTFELSQAYTMFWNKYEGANWFFENIIATADQPLDTMEMFYMLIMPVNDGGQWDMLSSLVKKYGVCPKEAMPETACSKNSRSMNTILSSYERYGAMKLRDAIAAGASSDEVDEIKKELLKDVYRILSICLGEPPESFEFRLRDDKGELKVNGVYTPKQFFDEFVGMDLDSYVSLISSPTQDKPYMRSYTVKYLGNVVEDGTVRYLNLPIEELKRVAVAQLKDGYPVWFGSDCGQAFSRDDGVFDLDMVQLDTLFGLPLQTGLDKGQRLDYGESRMNHAMVLQGVNFDADGNSDRWLIENSWGPEHGKKGYDVATDQWFSEYVYQVVVDKKYLTDEEIAAYESEPTVLAPWDPMGSLACCD